MSISWWGGKEGEGGKDRERLFVWLSTLCERGGGEEKRAGNTLEKWLHLLWHLWLRLPHMACSGWAQPWDPLGLTVTVCVHVCSV